MIQIDREIFAPHAGLIDEINVFPADDRERCFFQRGGDTWMVIDRFQRLLEPNFHTGTAALLNSGTNIANALLQ